MKFDPTSLPSQTGKIAIVTGANAGIGKETVVGLAKTGMKVVMACRSPARAEAARADILVRVPNGDLEIMQLDLASLASVRAFAEAVRAAHPKLDLLINNAGVMFPPHTRTEDGFDLQMAANYFGHFVLTALLLDRMPDTLESRVVSLASIAHKGARIDFGELRAKQGNPGARAYGQSKLACLMFSLELDRRLRQVGRKTLSVAAHPGVSETELGKHINRIVYALLKYTIAPFATHPPVMAVEPTLIAALNPEVEGGQYFGPQGFREMRGETGLAEIRPQAQDQAAAKRLWQLSEDLTGCSFSF